MYLIAMHPFLKLFDKQICFLSHARRISKKNFSGNLSWTYIHPYQAVKIDLCNASSLKIWATEGADEIFQQCLKCKFQIPKPVSNRYFGLEMNQSI